MLSRDRPHQSGLLMSLVSDRLACTSSAFARLAPDRSAATDPPRQIGQHDRPPTDWLSLGGHPIASPSTRRAPTGSPPAGRPSTRWPYAVWPSSNWPSTGWPPKDWPSQVGPREVGPRHDGHSQSARRTLASDRLASDRSPPTVIASTGWPRQVGPRHDGLPQFGLGQVGPTLQIGLPQSSGLRQVRLLRGLRQVGPRQIGPRQVGPATNRPATNRLTCQGAACATRSTRWSLDAEALRCSGFAITHAEGSAGSTFATHRAVFAGAPPLRASRDGGREFAFTRRAREGGCPGDRKLEVAVAAKPA